MDACVEALRTVYETSGYPTNWPTDPARWLRPPGILQAWVAATEDVPVAGHVLLMRPLPGDRSAAGGAAEVSRLFVDPAARRHGVAWALLETAKRSAAANDLDLFLDVTDHLAAARALYQRAGFRLVSTAQAAWTAPDGGPVTLHRYAWSRYALGETLRS
jgi:ribosomal protein S18 acetylase RimI-like enzyme